MASRPLLPGPQSARGLTGNVALNKPNKRINVSRACQACRRKRSRCDGKEPCQYCFATQQDCIYSDRDGRRRYERSEQLRRTQAKMEELKALLDMLKAGTDEEALQALQELRNTDNDDWRFMYASSPSPSSKSRQLHFSEKGYDPSRSDGDSPLDSPEDSTSGLPKPISIFTPAHLPPRETVKHGATFFFNVISTLFHVMDEKAFNDLCERVYAPKGNSSVPDLTEMCAIAAVGSQYNPHTVPDKIKDGLYNTAVQNTFQVAEHSSIQALRVLECLSVYGIIESRQSTRAVIHMGLMIARWSLDEYKEPSTDYLQWRRLYETAISLECWMSSTLGYYPDITSDELHMISGIPGASPASDEASHKMVARLGVLKVEVLRYVCCSDKPDSLEIEQHMVQLEAWHNSLPDQMSLSALRVGMPDPQNTIIQGASCLAHAKYLGTVILLHRPILAASADTVLGLEWKLSNVTRAQAEVYHSRSVSAARSLVRIFILLEIGTLESKMLLRCWLSLFELSTACTVLIYDISVKLSKSEPSALSDLSDDLERTERCLGMLESSVRIDDQAERLYTILSAIHQQLTNIYSNLPSERNHDTEANISAQSGSKRRNPPRADVAAGPYNEIEGRDIITHAITTVAGILRDPFGHGAETGFDLPSGKSSWDTMDNGHDMQMT